MPLNRRISRHSPIPNRRCMTIFTATATAIRTINPNIYLRKRHISRTPLDTLALAASPRTHRELAPDKHRLITPRLLEEAHRADLDVGAALLAAPEPCH